jgi:hypothetical protein
VSLLWVRWQNRRSGRWTSMTHLTFAFGSTMLVVACGGWVAALPRLVAPPPIRRKLFFCLRGDAYSTT